MQNQKIISNGRTDERADGVTSSLLELFIAAKNDPKIKSKSKVSIEENIENKSWSTTQVDPKTVFEPYPDPKNSLVGPNKSKTRSNSIIRRDENWF